MSECDRFEELSIKNEIRLERRTMTISKSIQESGEIKRSFNEYRPSEDLKMDHRMNAQATVHTDSRAIIEAVPASLLCNALALPSQSL